jgi:hypothetical protein
MFAAPFEDLRDGCWGFALISLLLWPVGLFGLLFNFLADIIRVLWRGKKDESLEPMWDKFADSVTSAVFRCQPDGSEITPQRDLSERRTSSQ